MQPMKSLATAVTRPIATAFRPMTSMFSGRMVRQCHSCNRNSEEAPTEAQKVFAFLLGSGAVITGFIAYGEAATRHAEKRRYDAIWTAKKGTGGR